VVTVVTAMIAMISLPNFVTTLSPPFARGGDSNLQKIALNKCPQNPARTIATPFALQRVAFCDQNHAA
jgi:hypothetical protein